MIEKKKASTDPTKSNRGWKILPIGVVSEASMGPSLRARDRRRVHPRGYSRTSRLAASDAPRAAPCRSMAYTAYSEQVGRYRHPVGRPDRSSLVAVDGRDHPPEPGPLTGVLPVTVGSGRPPWPPGAVCRAGSGRSPGRPVRRVGPTAGRRAGPAVALSTARLIATFSSIESQRRTARALPVPGRHRPEGMGGLLGHDGPQPALQSIPLHCIPNPPVDGVGHSYL